MNHPAKIIYIDDDPEDRHFFEEVISDLDRNVMLISSGMHFFDFVGDDLLANSIIFVDLNLPKISGQEIIENLRRKFTPSQVPIIVLSGSEDQSVIADCYARGANGYLVKASGYNPFKDSIEKALNIKWRRHQVTNENFKL